MHLVFSSLSWQIKLLPKYEGWNQRVLGTWKCLKVWHDQALFKPETVNAIWNSKIKILDTDFLCVTWWVIYS